jgi:phenylacetic acid degradation protein
VESRLIRFTIAGRRHCRRDAAREGGPVPCFEINGLVPVVDPTAFVHPTATLVGDVIVGPGCYVAPGASLRGDFGRIILERGSNVQDSCVMHGFPGTDTIVEEDGHIGHGAILHGCIVKRNAMVGMNAVVMDEAVVGESAIVAACAFVKAGMVIPPRGLAVGAPAKVIRQLSDDEVTWKISGTRSYQDLTTRSLATLREVTPLAAVEPGRKRISIDVEGVVPLAVARRE